MELVDKETYQKRGELAWELLDERALKTLDLLREMFGCAIVNDYPFGMKNQFRGFRPRNCEVGAEYSMHKQGKAFDVSFWEAYEKDVKNYIYNHSESFPYITCIEKDVSWLHFDVRNCNPIKIVSH
jgi:hypothetical protein